MKIYYIKNGKCIDIIDKLNVANKVMAYTVPMLMTGERLIDYYMRVPHGNVVDVGVRMASQYILFCQDTIKALPYYFLGDIANVKFYSDAMNILIANMN